MISKNICTNFVVDVEKVIFFLDYLSINKNLNTSVTDANRFLEKTKRNWQEVEDDIIKLYISVFGLQKPLVNITIYIFPEYFYLGASESSKQLILFGQPSRTLFFSSAIIAHEISHIFLSSITQKRPPIVDEIISCLFENYIYKTFERTNFVTVWSGYNFDIYHQASYDFILKNPDISITKINKETVDITKMIHFINTKLTPDLIDLKPEVGLLNQLQTN